MVNLPVEARRHCNKRVQEGVDDNANQTRKVEYLCIPLHVFVFFFEEVHLRRMLSPVATCINECIVFTHCLRHVHLFLLHPKAYLDESPNPQHEVNPLVQIEEYADSQEQRGQDGYDATGALHILTVTASPFRIRYLNHGVDPEYVHGQE